MTSCNNSIHSRTGQKHPYINLSTLHPAHERMAKRRLTLFDIGRQCNSSSTSSQPDVSTTITGTLSIKLDSDIPMLSEPDCLETELASCPSVTQSSP